MREVMTGDIGKRKPQFELRLLFWSSSFSLYSIEVASADKLKLGL